MKYEEVNKLQKDVLYDDNNKQLFNHARIE